MSGGAFDYIQFKIKSDVLDNIKERLLEDRDTTFPVDPDYLIQEFKMLVNCFIFTSVSNAHINRVDWFISGDDSFESFKTRMIEDLAEADVEVENLINKGAEKLIQTLNKFNTPNDKMCQYLEEINQVKDQLRSF